MDQRSIITFQKNINHQRMLLIAHHSGPLSPLHAEFRDILKNKLNFSIGFYVYIIILQHITLASNYILAGP